MKNLFFKKMPLWLLWVTVFLGAGSHFGLSEAVAVFCMGPIFLVISVLLGAMLLFANKGEDAIIRLTEMMFVTALSVGLWLGSSSGLISWNALWAVIITVIFVFSCVVTSDEDLHFPDFCFAVLVMAVMALVRMESFTSLFGCLITTKMVPVLMSLVFAVIAINDRSLLIYCGFSQGMLFVFTTLGNMLLPGGHWGVMIFIVIVSLLSLINSTAEWIKIIYFIIRDVIVIPKEEEGEYEN